MKKFIWVIAILVLCACGSSKNKKAESKTSNASLEQRLQEYRKLNEELNIDKLMDYIYPKLFTLAPREDMVKGMKDFFASDEIKVVIDSLTIDRIHPVFQIGDGSYAKVEYSMVMRMDMSPKDTVEDEGQNEMIVQTMRAQYGEENVDIDKATGMIRIRTVNPMVAVKDEYAKEWSFVSLKEDDPMINQLFSKEVLDKLKTYK